MSVGLGVTVHLTQVHHIAVCRFLMLVVATRADRQAELAVVVAAAADHRA